jgi:hypothetical protein
MAFILKIIWNSKLIMNSTIAIILFYMIGCFYKTNTDNTHNNTHDSTRTDTHDNTLTDTHDNTRPATNDKTFSDLFKNVNTKKTDTILIKDTEKIKLKQTSKDNLYILYIRMFIAVFISSGIINAFW